MNLIKVALSHCCCRTTLQCHHVVLNNRKRFLKQVSFSVPAEMRRSTKQPGLAEAESSKPELRLPEKRDRRLLCGMSTVPAERLIQESGAVVLKNG